MPKVVHCRLDSYDVFIGDLTASPYNNPLLMNHALGSALGEQIQAVYDYEIFLLKNRALINKMKAELQGKTLGCFCAPKGGVGPDDKLICHGQLILRAVRGDYG